MARSGKLQGRTGASLTTTARGALMVALTVVISQCSMSLAGPIPMSGGGDLSLSLMGGLGGSADETIAAAGGASQQTKLMEQIMNDDFGHDFELSIKTLNQLAGNLEEFVRREQMTEQVGKHANLMSMWAAQKGGSSMNAILAELDYVMATFWSKFKPLVEAIVTQRPQGLGPNDLDFRCKRVNELKELQEMSTHSSIYSMYLGTFYSELHLHCLLRKLALVKNNGVAPSALLKQFVDIYLELPTSKDPMRAASKELQEQAAHQILAGHAISFKLDTALAQHGPLSSAAQLVFDPRTALSLTPDSGNVDIMLKEFESDCQSHNALLGQIWGDFDDLSAFLSSQTCNFVELNGKLKLAAPQLVYGSICGQLLQLPR